VEQFNQEFSDAVAVTQWSPCVALLQLWMALTDKAKPYGLGPDVNSIFAVLLTQFGILAIDALVRLQRCGLTRTPLYNNTPPR